MSVPGVGALVRLGEAVAALSTTLSPPPPSGTAMRFVPEFIVFTMRCPGCGQDAKWRAERDGDKSHLTKPECACGVAA